MIGVIDTCEHVGMMRDFSSDFCLIINFFEHILKVGEDKIIA